LLLIALPEQSVDLSPICRQQVTTCWKITASKFNENCGAITGKIFLIGTPEMISWSIGTFVPP
jgi:hypothetical protein